MKATINGRDIMINRRTVQIFFNYGEAPILNEGKDSARYVECVIRPFPIQPGTEPKPLASGRAVCSPLDNFNKSKGRLLAWKRAIGDELESPFTREQRQDLWTWFTNTCRLPENTKV